MKIIDAAAAADLIQSGWNVAAAGFGGCCHPEALTAQIEERFVATGMPRDLTIIVAASTGDRVADRIKLMDRPIFDEAPMVAGASSHEA